MRPRERGFTSSGRAMVRPGRDRLAGEVEVDETYVGGAAPRKDGRGAEGRRRCWFAVEKRGRGPLRLRTKDEPARVIMVIARRWPDSGGMSGSDETRTRDLRRDRPEIT